MVGLASPFTTVPPKLPTRLRDVLIHFPQFSRVLDFKRLRTVCTTTPSLAILASIEHFRLAIKSSRPKNSTIHKTVSQRGGVTSYLTSLFNMSQKHKQLSLLTIFLQQPSPFYTENHSELSYLSSILLRAHALNSHVSFSAFPSYVTRRAI